MQYIYCVFNIFPEAIMLISLYFSLTSAALDVGKCFCFPTIHAALYTCVFVHSISSKLLLAKRKQKIGEKRLTEEKTFRHSFDNFFLLLEMRPLVRT